MRRQLVDGHAQSARWQRALAVALACLCASWLRSVSAQTTAGQSCGPEQRAWIAIQTPEPSPGDELDWQNVVRHLAGELAVRGVDLCSVAKSSRPLSRLQLTTESATRVRITLLAGDDREGAEHALDPDTRLGERALELGAVPADARLLAIAVATDELLAANWGEIERRWQRAAEASKVRKPEPAPPPAPRADLRFLLGPVFAFDAFGGGQRLLGVDARAAFRFAPRLALTARIGVRQGLPQGSDHGSVHATALLGGLGVRLELARSERLRIDLFGRVDALRLNASAYANPGAIDRKDDAVAVTALAGVDLRLLLSRSVQLMLEAGLGGVPRPVHITDAGQRVSGVSALALTLGGGVSAAF